MNIISKKTAFFLFIGICILGLCGDVFAQEGISQGRKLWDNILLFFNFGILVFLFIKFARKPLMNFFFGEKNKIRERLDSLDSKFQAASSAISAEAEKLKNIDEQLNEMREQILQIGIDEKEKIIAEAHVAAAQMLEKTKAESEYRLIGAKKALNNEVVDIAVTIAEERLLKGISSEDNDNVISHFLDNLSENKKYFESSL
ncbi:MAG: ATP synthase F0 subunit B [Deltaproteobacteria bacterium]|nr:ATP synthase F0 subunit B [Deltaproteobacteria bacterium]